MSDINKSDNANNIKATNTNSESTALNGKKSDFIPKFATMPILDSSKKLKESGVNIPSEADVSHAKTWVDTNEL